MDSETKQPEDSIVASDAPQVDVADACPLPRSQQTRNLLLFASCTGLQYLAAPVLYVGITQASLCDHLGANDKTANLPGTLYFSMTAMPVLLAWLFPYVSYLKRNLVVCYSATSIILGVVAITLLLPVSNNIKIGVVVLQGAVSGLAMPAAIAFLWEVIGRGSAESRRGVALGLAFGAGPILAVVGSLMSQLMLSGTLGSLTWELEYPWNFALLFAAGAPVMALAAFLSSRFVVPLPEQDFVRKPFFSAVFGGLWDFLSNRILLTATIVTILVYTGNTIPSNMNLYTTIVLDDLPENYAGLQNTLRFSFKVAAGFLLGWLLLKTSPKFGILATASIFVTAQLWAIFATGTWYLVAFGIYGAGELVGVYAPNYILSASPKKNYRRNMAFVTMMMAPAAPAGYMFGAISDAFKTADGVPTAAGYQTSFAVCAAIMVAGIVIAIVALPARPRPD